MRFKPVPPVTFFVAVACSDHSMRAAVVGLNLVPPAGPSGVSAPPIYFNTWQAQGRSWMSLAADLSQPQVEDFWRHRTHEGWMVQAAQNNTFQNDSATGRVGWAWLFPRARSDMFFVLDNGWQHGAEGNSDRLVWDSNKWPMFGNSTAALEPMTKMAQFVEAQGWRGLGLWVNGGDGVGEAEMKILDRAGILLLKADGGDATCRKTALARQLAPRLVVEHGKCVTGCPLNTGSRNSSRVSTADLAAQLPELNCTDLLRTYDTVTVFSISEVLERQARLLQAAQSLGRLGGPARRLLGGSGEPSVTAALGGAVQPMRSNIRGVPLPPALLAYNGEGPHSRQLQHREDEVERLVLWARIAPPFGVAKLRPEQVKLDTKLLVDSWNFRLCDDAAVIGHHLENKTVEQAAPARVSRGGLPLPTVTTAANQLAPFVVSTRFPSGPVSVTTLGRTRGRTYTEPTAHITQRIPHASEGSGENSSCPCGVCGVPALGVFGHFASLTVEYSSYSNNLGHRNRACRIYAQDLVGTVATDITDRVQWTVDAMHQGSTLVIPGAVIASVGTVAKSRSDDVSPPGMVVVLETPATKTKVYE